MARIILLITFLFGFSAYGTGPGTSTVQSTMAASQSQPMTMSIKVRYQKSSSSLEEEIIPSDFYDVPGDREIAAKQPEVTLDDVFGDSQDYMDDFNRPAVKGNLVFRRILDSLNRREQKN